MARGQVIIVTETPRVQPARTDLSLEEYVAMGAPALVDLYPGASDEEMCRHEDRLLPYLLIQDDGVLFERSEERRVGNECRRRVTGYQDIKDTPSSKGIAALCKPRS